MEVTEISARSKYILFSVIFVATSIISVFLIIKYSYIIAEFQRYGYLGLFLIALIAGSSIPTPISYLLLTFTFGGILNPAFVGLAAGLGAGIGGTLVFLVGRGGRHILPGMRRYSLDDIANNKLAAKFVGWAQRRGSIVVFVMSAMLNPVFAPMAIAMGALKFRMIKFFLLCVAGNIVKAMVISYAGYLGVGSILRWLGS